MDKSDTSGIGDIFRSVQMDEGILSQRAAQQISELVAAGELREGDRLPAERELGEYLGVSRTVVREAIKLLKAAGLVRVRPGVGSFVTEPTTNILEGPLTYITRSRPRIIEELVQARELLEPPIAALAAQNATAEHIARMEHAANAMEAYGGNMNRYIEADNDFHSALAEATQNSVLQLILFSVVDLLQEGRRLAIQSPGGFDRANYYHRLILDAVKAGQSEAARNAMNQHLEQIKSELQVTLRGRSPSMAVAIQRVERTAE